MQRDVFLKWRGRNVSVNSKRKEGMEYKMLRASGGWPAFYLSTSLSLRGNQSFGIKLLHFSRIRTEVIPSCSSNFLTVFIIYFGGTYCEDKYIV